MRKRRLPDPASKSSRLDPSVFFFSIAFFLGVIGGYFCCRASGAGSEIKEYLNRYAQVLVAGGTVTTASLLGAAVSYYRVPCAVYLCGVFRHAFYLICGVFLLEGFLLSFAVANFTLALGRSGVLISLCVFGTRILLIFPISIAIALRRMRSAGERTGRRTKAKGIVRQPRSTLLYFQFGHTGFGRFGRAYICSKARFACTAAAFINDSQKRR